mgnify:CR=1 FL=1
MNPPPVHAGNSSWRHTPFRKFGKNGTSCRMVHGGTRHLEKCEWRFLRQTYVHGGTRHLEIVISLIQIKNKVHGGTRHLEILRSMSVRRH